MKCPKCKTDGYKLSNTVYGCTKCNNLWTSAEENEKSRKRNKLKILRLRLMNGEITQKQFDEGVRE